MKDGLESGCNRERRDGQFQVPGFPRNPGGGQAEEYERRRSFRLSRLELTKSLEFYWANLRGGRGPKRPVA
jgi:hypothetical protein